LKPQVSPDVTDLEVKPEDVPIKKPVRHRQWGGAATGLLLGIFALALGRAGQLWPAFDVAAQFGAQSLCLVAGFAVAALMPRFKALIGMILSGLFVLGYGLWPLVVSGQPVKANYTLAAGERAITIVQFNTYRFNSDVTALADEIERLNGDIVVLEEFDPPKLQLMQKLKLRYPYQFNCIAVEECDLAIVSRFPFVDAAAQGRWAGPVFIKAKFGGGASGLTVIGLHTTRFPFSRAQLKQIQAMIKRLETESAPLVVAGDFNATPFSRVTTTLEQSTGLRRLTGLPTWPTRVGIPQLAIDHVFASPDIRTLSGPRIGNAAGSDHFPVVITLGVPAP
jgi:endonuclease/exonuclease/phosphatase (EEP) superfamily protein YafD